MFGQKLTSASLTGFILLVFITKAIRGVNNLKITYPLSTVVGVLIGNKPVSPHGIPRFLYKNMEFV